MCAFWKKKKTEFPAIYSEEEMAAVEDFIVAGFGGFDEVFHEIVSPDIHVDIVIIPPAEGRNYHTLITMGMGAFRMDVPRQFRDYCSDRAEIMVTLPADWDIKSDAEEDYWPVRWLKVLARLPINNDTWLGWGHTIPNGEPFADDTELSDVILQTPLLREERMICTLPGGGEVEFFHMIPLYEEEREFKISNGSEMLFELFGHGFPHVVNKNRKNYCTGTGIVS